MISPQATTADVRAHQQPTPIGWWSRVRLSNGFRRARIAGALAGAVVTTTLFLTSETPLARANKYAMATEHAHIAATRVGVATLGPVYLDTPPTEQTASAAGPTLRALDAGLDPARQDGTLYPLRKGMEQLAGLLIFPLLIIGVVHTLVTARDDADTRLRDLGIQFFAVVAMLWVYPLWDWVLYRQIADPLTQALSNGAVVQQIASNISSRTRTSVPGFTDGVTDPSFSPGGEMSAFWQNDLACPVELAASTAADSAASRCTGDSVPVSRKLMHQRSQEGLMLGSAAQKDSAVSSMNPDERTWRDNLVQAIRGFASSVSQAANFDLGQWVIGNVGNWLSSTVAGILLTLESLIAAAVLWLVWLGVIVARAMSLTLAPIALVWGLMPGVSALSRPKKWFVGHAKIALMPVGVAFGLLVYWAVMTAIFDTPMMSDLIIGLALKFALFLGFLVTVFKTTTLTNLLAGDVAEVATDFGHAVRTKTIELAGTAAALGTGVVAGGLGARLANANLGRVATSGASSGAATVAARGGPGAVASSTAQAMGAAPSTFNQPFRRPTPAPVTNVTGTVGTTSPAGGTGAGVGTGQSAGQPNVRVNRSLGATASTAPTSAALGTSRTAGNPAQSGRRATAARWLGRAKNAVIDGARNDLVVLKWALEHRVTAAHVQQGVGTTLHASFLSPLQRAQEELLQLQQRRQRTGHPGVSSILDRLKSRRGTQGSPVHNQGVAESAHAAAKRASGGESGASADSPVTGANEATTAATLAPEHVAQSVTDALVGLDTPITESWGGRRSQGDADSAIALTPAALTALHQHMQDNPAFRQSIQEEATRVYGANGMRNDDGHPGSGLDLADLIHRSPLLGSAIRTAAAAQATAATSVHDARVAHATAVTGVAPHSVAERILRASDPRVIHQPAGESDDAYQRRLNTHVTHVMRRAWYLQADEEERAAAGLPRQGGESQAERTLSIDVHPWQTAGSVQGLSDPAAHAIGKAVADHHRRLWDLQQRQVVDRGVRHGFVAQDYVATQGKTERYHFQPGSVFDAVYHDRPDLHEQQHDVYTAARQHVLTESRYHGQIPTEPLPGETEEQFHNRVEVSINRLVFLNELSHGEP